MKYTGFDAVFGQSSGLIFFSFEALPTNPNAVAEFTDWEQVENFGRSISEMHENT